MKTLSYLRTAVALAVLFSCTNETGDEVTPSGPEEVCQHIQMDINDEFDPLHLQFEFDRTGRPQSVTGTGSPGESIDLHFKYDIVDGLVAGDLGNDYAIVTDAVTGKVISFQYGDSGDPDTWRISFAGDRVTTGYFPTDDGTLESYGYTYDDVGNLMKVKSIVLDENDNDIGTLDAEFEYHDEYKALFSTAPFLEAFMTIRIYGLPFPVTSVNLPSNAHLTYKINGQTLTESRLFGYTFDNNNHVTQVRWSNSVSTQTTDFKMDCN